MQEIRLDLFLKQNYNFSREHSKEIILKGYVKVNGKVIFKPAFKIVRDFFIEINPEAIPKYVSRGGLKLEKALNLFKINLNNKVCLDIGASTGGFSDCMLKNGAKKVYALDVGSSQLDQSLLNNEKIISMESTDIRSIKKFPEYIDFISIDVSFISLTKILENVFNLLESSGNIVALIKPQFEAGIGNIDKNGVVKNKKIHKQILQNIYNFSRPYGFYILDLTFSPICGRSGNIEYLVYFTKDFIIKKFDFKEIISNAFKELK